MMDVLGFVISANKNTRSEISSSLVVLSNQNSDSENCASEKIRSENILC